MSLHDALQPLHFIHPTAIRPEQFIEVGMSVPCSPISPNPALYVLIHSLMCISKICIVTVLFVPGNICSEYCTELDSFHMEFAVTKTIIC